MTTNLQTPSAQAEIAAQTEAVLHDGDMFLSFPRGRHAEFQARPAAITICLPVYNAAASLTRCLDSILSQTGADFQVMVVDNASTDTTFADACRYASEHPNVVVYRNAVNIGRVPNWNRCLGLVQSEFVKFVMVNDYLLPGALACLHWAMQRYPSVVLARTRLHHLRPGEGVSFISEWPMSLVLPSDTAVDVGMTQFNLCAGPTVQMLRRAPIAEHRLRFDPGLSWASDYHFSQRLLRHGDFAYVHESGIVMDLSGERFHNGGNRPLILREDLEVTLRSFEDTGAQIDRAEAVVERIQREYTQHTAQTSEAASLAEMQETFVQALHRLEQLLRQKANARIV